MKAGAKSRLLSSARRRLGLNGSAPRVLVVASAAAQLGAALPKTKAAGYQLLAVLIGTTAPPPRVAKTAKPRTFGGDVNTDAFLLSYAWRRLRMVVLTKRGARCECCGATPKDGLRMHVDHIKPRRLFPELALEEANLQILCEVCNHGKGNWDQTDWRHDPITVTWLNQHRTARGGWTRAQLEAVGVSWPPTHGWQQTITGRVVTPAQRTIFESVNPLTDEDACRIWDRAEGKPAS